MGWLKDKYQKLDTKLGGVLPGKGNEQPTATPQPTITQAAPQAPVSAASPFLNKPANMSTETGPAYAPPPTVNAPTTPNYSSSNVSNNLSTGSSSRTPLTPAPQEDGAIVRALKYYFSDDNPLTDVLGGKSPQVNPETGEYEYNTNTIAFGTGNLVAGAEKIIAKQVAKKAASSKIQTTLTQFMTTAGRAGTKIEASNAVVNVGDDLLGNTVKNTGIAKKISNAIISKAKQISPKNWKAILGIITGAATSVGGVSVWSGFSMRNSYSDTQQTLGFARSDAQDRGDFDTADSIAEMQDDATDIYNEVNHVFSNPWTAVQSIASFVDDTRDAADLKDADLKAKKAQEDYKQELVNKVMDGTATPEEIAYIQDEYPDIYGAQNVINDEQEFAVDSDRLAYGQELATRILQDRPTAEQIINDPEIRAFALDPNNQFSAVTKLYNEAIAATGRGNFFGEDGAGGSTEPASTLNFGLLSTGSEQQPADETPPEQLAAQTLDEQAMSTFGIPYAQLTEAQRVTLE